MKRNILRIVVAVIACLLMGIIGLNVGIFINSDNMSVVFVVITMGAFIMYEIQRRKKTD